MTIIEAAAAWTAHLATQGLKDGTVDVYGRDVARFAEYMGGDKELETITVPRINGYLKSNKLLKDAKGKPWATATLNRSKRVCRMFLEWCVSAGHVTDLPASAINLFKTSVPRAQ